MIDWYGENLNDYEKTCAGFSALYWLHYWMQGGESGP